MTLAASTTSTPVMLACRAGDDDDGAVDGEPVRANRRTWDPISSRYQGTHDRKWWTTNVRGRGNPPYLLEFTTSKASQRRLRRGLEITAQRCAP